MRLKPHRGTNGRGYADRRLAEIVAAQSSYPRWRSELLAIAEILTVPQPFGRRLVKGGR